MTKINPIEFEGLSVSGRKAAATALYAQQSRSLSIALLLWLFTGGAGGHRFYLGDYKIGGLIFGLWVVVLIPLAIFAPTDWRFGIFSLWFVLMLVELGLLIGAVPKRNEKMKTEIYAMADLT